MRRSRLNEETARAYARTLFASAVTLEQIAAELRVDMVEACVPHVAWTRAAVLYPPGSTPLAILRGLAGVALIQVSDTWTDDALDAMVDVLRATLAIQSESLAAV